MTCTIWKALMRIGRECKTEKIVDYLNYMESFDENR